MAARMRAARGGAVIAASTRTAHAAAAVAMAFPICLPAAGTEELLQKRQRQRTCGAGQLKSTGKPWHMPSWATVSRVAA